MKGLVSVVVVAMGVIASASAQDIMIESIIGNGRMTFSGTLVGTTATVEWAASLTDVGQTNWNSLTNIVVTGNVMTNDIVKNATSMFFRVCGISYTNLMNGILAYYPFNANADDESGNGHTGTVSSATLTQDRFGATDAAYLFDGTNSQITAAGVEMSATNITIAFWSKRSDSDPNSFRWVVSHGTPAKDTGLHVGYRGSSQRFSFDFFEDGFDTPTVQTDLDGAWHSWTVTYNKSSQARSIYKDGSLIAFNTSSGKYAGSGTLYIGGAWTWPNTQFQGAIDDVRIYGRELSSNEVYALYIATRP